MQKYLYFNRLPNIQASFKQLTGNSASSQKKLTTVRYRTRQVTRCITRQTYTGWRKKKVNAFDLV